MNYMYEMYFKEIYNDRLAQAAAARKVREAHAHLERPSLISPRKITDVLQQFRLKIIGVYHNLYQNSKKI